MADGTTSYIIPMFTHFPHTIPGATPSQAGVMTASQAAAVAALATSGSFTGKVQTKNNTPTPIVTIAPTTTGVYLVQFNAAASNLNATAIAVWSYFAAMLGVDANGTLTLVAFPPGAPTDSASPGPATPANWALSGAIVNNKMVISVTGDILTTQTVNWQLVGTIIGNS